MARKGKSLLSLKPRKKKARRHVPDKYIGQEPTWTSEPATELEMSKAYNWYNYENNLKERVKLLWDNYPRDKREIKVLKRLPEWKINSSVCYLARMIAMGCVAGERATKSMNEKLDEHLAEAKNIRAEKKEEQNKTAPKPSIQERIKEQVSEYIGEIESEVDTFTQSKYKSDFNMYKWLQKKNVKSQQANAIAAYYKPLITELLELQGGVCEQLNEAYSFMKKVEVKRFVEFMAMIIGDAETWGSNQKTVRKTRVKKPQSVQKQVSRLNYLKEDAKFKLVSVDPANIIGANQLWIFNTKYKALRRYDALGPAGFSISGSTLKGFDSESSIEKALRKPDEVLPNVLTGGKRVLSKIFDTLTSKQREPNGRINKDCIILKVVK